MKEPKDIADKYLERYSQLVSWNTKFSLIALVVLTANWFFIVETNFSAYKTVRQEYKYKFETIENQFIELNQKYSDDKEAYKEEREKLSDQKVALSKEKQSSYKDKMAEVNNWPSLVKFIFFISDNTERGGLILNVLFFLLLTYLLFTRRSCLKCLSKAVRIYKIEPELQINKYHDFNLSAPIWIAPLPEKQNRDVTPQDLKNILGWTYNHRFMQLGLSAFLATIFILQIRLAYITFLVNASNFNTVFIASLLFVMLTSVVIVYWLFPIGIEDNFNYERSPNRFSRRDFVSVSMFGIFTISLYRFAPLIPKYIHKRVPRFSVNKIKLDFKLPNLKGGLMKNKKTNILHYINGEGYSISFKTISNRNEFETFSKNIKPFTEINRIEGLKGSPRFPVKHSSWVAESFAFDKIKSGEIEDAIGILMKAIKQNIDKYNISYRLHDLLAIICIRYETKIPGDTLQKLIELSSLSSDKSLVARVKKWNDKKWREKIANKEEIIFNKNKI